MNLKVQICAIVAAVCFAILVLELVRKRRLREEYSLLWIAAIITIAALAIHRPSVTSIANLIGVAYAPSALFIVAFAVGFLLLLHFSAVISRIMERNKRLTQEIGLMKLRLEKLEQCNEVKGDDRVGRT